MAHILGSHYILKKLLITPFILLAYTKVLAKLVEIVAYIISTYFSRQRDTFGLNSFERLLLK